MRRLLVVIFLQLFIFVAFAQEKSNQFDSQKRKQGSWSEQMPEIKGEPGYTWEGNYVNNLKEGLWKKYAESGGLIAEETFKHGVLNGHSRYFYSNGLVSAEGSYVAIDIDGQKDTYRVIDPVTGEEKMEEIARNANSQRDGIWKVYDEEGHISKEYYKRGEPVSPEELDSLAPVTPQKTAPANFLPHQNTGGKKRKH